MESLIEEQKNLKDVVELGDKNNEKVGGKKSFLRIFVLVLLLLWVLGLAYFFLVKKDVVDDSGIGITEDGLETKKPEGEIYLTLSPLGTNKPNIYKLDVEKMELEEYFPDSPYANLMAQFSPDGSKMVFVRGYQDMTSQILLLDLESNILTELTDKMTFYPRNPQFSSDGTKVVYWVYENTITGRIADNPEDNSIYMVSLSGVEEKIAGGAFPFFVDNDNKIIFLSNTGLYSFDLNTKKGGVFVDSDLSYLNSLISLGVVQDDLPSWSSLRFSISNSGDLIILTDTIASQIKILAMDSWEKLSSEFLFKVVSGLDIATNPNWPVFSPKNDFVVLQSYNMVREEMQVSVLAFDGVNLSLFEGGVLSLSNYDTQLIWITDWIVHR